MQIALSSKTDSVFLVNGCVFTATYQSTKQVTLKLLTTTEKPKNSN